jgi:hypothetical protein
MLELQPLETWSATSKAETPAEKIKGYSDYLQASYFKAGALDNDVYAGIREGAKDYAKANGLLDAALPEEEQDKQIGALIGAKNDPEKDARFLLQHYSLDFDLNKPEFAQQKANADTLRKYFAMKKVNPAGLPEIEPLVAEIVGDVNEVRDARIAALDRKETPLVAVTDVDGRRQVYPGADATPEFIRENLDSLLSTGVIDAGDLNEVHTLLTPINGGKATVAEEVKGRTLASTVKDLTDKDPELKSALNDSVSRLRRRQELEGKSGGELAVDAALQVAGVAGSLIGELGTALVGGEAFKTEPKKDIVKLLANNESLLSKGYSEQDIRRYAADIVQSNAGPAYRADKPESGIGQDSRGNLLLAPTLVTNKALFEQAVQAAGLNEEQRKRATDERGNYLTQLAPDVKRLIVENDDEAAAEYAAAKGRGETDEQFVENWIANKGDNYSGFTERLQQLGNTVGRVISEVPLGLAVLSGSETATKTLQAIQKDATDRREYSRLMGDEYGLTFQIVDAVPQLASQILMASGAGAAYTGLKSVVKSGARKVLGTAAKNALSLVDDATAAAIKSSAKVGGEALMPSALKQVGNSVGSALKLTDEALPLFASTFYQGTTSTYVSIYSQLPDTMSHEDKHRNSLGYAIGSGLSTAALTMGMGFLGRSGAEDLATKVFRPLKAADEVAAGSRVIPLDKLTYKQAKLAHEAINNAGAGITDAAFKKVLRVNLSGAYKNFLRNTYKGAVDEGVEEVIDTAINTGIENAALNRDTSLIEMGNQMWHAFVIGGALGGGVKGLTELAAPMRFSDRVQALQSAVDTSQRIAKTLRDSGSTATAAVFERNMEAQVGALREGKKAEVAAQQETQQRQETELTEFPEDGQAVFDFDDDIDTSSEQGMIVGDLIGERVNVGAFQGELQRNNDGSFSLKLDKPINGATTVALSVTAFQPLGQTKITRRTPLATLGSAQGNIAAGTPYILLANKARVALPTRTPERGQESFEFSKAGYTEVLTVRGGRIVGTDDTMDFKITDPDQINNIVKYYGLQRPTEAVPDAQFELPLFDLDEVINPEPIVVEDEAEAEAGSEVGTPAKPKREPRKRRVTRNKAPEAELTEEELQAELQAELQEELQAEADRVEVDESLSILDKNDVFVRSILKFAKNTNPKAAQAVTKIATPALIADLESKLQQLDTYAAGLGPEKISVRDSIKQTAQSLREALEAIPVVAIETPTPISETPSITPVTTPKKRAPKNGGKKVIAGKQVELPAEVEDPKAEVEELQTQLDEVNVADVQVSFGAKLYSLEDAQGMVEKFMATDSPMAKKAAQKWQDAINKALAGQEAEAKPIEEKIKQLETSTEESTEPADLFTDELLSVIAGSSSLPTEQQQKGNKAKKPKAVPQITTPTTNEYGFFRNDDEARQFASWVEGGFVFGDIGQFFSRTNVSGIPLTKRKAGTQFADESYFNSIKRRLVQQVQAKYPTIPIPEGTPTRFAQAASTNILTGVTEKLAVPVTEDRMGDAVRGVFTNDPRITAEQLRLKLTVIVPEGFVGLNPSIQAPNGNVKRVFTSPSDTVGVVQATERRLSGKMAYVPKGREELGLQLSAFRTPTPQNLMPLQGGDSWKGGRNDFDSLMKRAAELLYPSNTAALTASRTVSLRKELAERLDQDIEEQLSEVTDPTLLEAKKAQLAVYKKRELNKIGKENRVADFTAKAEEQQVDTDSESFKASLDAYLSTSLDKKKAQLEADLVAQAKSNRVKTNTTIFKVELARSLASLEKNEARLDALDTVSNQFSTADEKSRRTIQAALTEAGSLREEFVDTVRETALVEYGNTLKQLALGNKISAALRAKSKQNVAVLTEGVDAEGQPITEITYATPQDVTLDDIDLAKIVRDEMVSPAAGNRGRASNAEVNAVLGKIAGVKSTGDPDNKAAADTAAAIYGRMVYERVTEGDLFGGALPSLATIVRKRTKAALEAQSKRSPKTLSIDAPVTGETVLQSFSELITPDEADYTAAEGKPVIDQLAEFLDLNYTASTALRNAIGKAMNNVVPASVDSSGLIDLAGANLAAKSDIAIVLGRELMDQGSYGQKILRELMAEGWFPPPTTLATTPTPTQARRVVGAEAASALQTAARAAKTSDTLKEVVARARKLLINSDVDARLSRSDENVKATGAARSYNSSEANRLGLVSGSPESVLGALQEIARSGTPNDRTVAELLLTNEDLIQNTNFVIGDFDDVRFAGAFMPKSNLVVLNISGHNGRGLANVLMHEYLHAVSTKLILNPQTANQLAAVKRIEQLRTLAGNRMRALGLESDQWADALGSNDEFVTYVLTDPEFQSLVKAATPAEQRSLFRRFVDAVLELFGVKADTRISDPVAEILNFTSMFASDMTFSLDSRKQLRNRKREVEAGLDELRSFLAQSTELLTTYRDGVMPDVRMAVGEPTTAATEGEPTIDPVSVFRNQVPADIEVVLSDTLRGEAAVLRSRPNTIFLNPALFANRVTGLNARGAQAAIKSLVDHELGHMAVHEAFTENDIKRVATELGTDRLQQIASDYYGSTGLSGAELNAQIEADRANGTLTDSMLADEWLRMQATKAAIGRTFEQDFEYALSDPSLFDSLLRAIDAFVTRLRSRFAAAPTTETAAGISRAERTLRKLKERGPDRRAEATVREASFGDLNLLLQAIEGSPDGDRASYSIAYMSSAEGKVERSETAIADKLKLYNLPSQLRDIITRRTQAVNSAAISTKSFVRRFPKLRDRALAEGVAIEDIRLLFGTTAPDLSAADQRDIELAVKRFSATLDPDLSSDERAEAIERKQAALEATKRNKFRTEFRKRQQAAEQSVRAQGFPDLVNEAVALRKDINRARSGGGIGFDESDDIYLTRTYRFFTTTGWSLAAKYGSTIKIDGKDVDFHKLRETAAKLFVEQADAYFAKIGKPYSNKDVDARTVELLDQYLETLEKVHSSVDKTVVDSLRKDLDRFKPKKDIDGSLRALLGEIDDPLTNAINTLHHVSMLSANENFRKSFAEAAIATGFASRTPVGDWRPVYPASTEATMGPLAGLYMEPKAAAALLEAFGSSPFAPQSNSTAMVNKVGTVLSRVSGAVVFGATKLGFGYWPRNVIGAFLLGAAQGILWNPATKATRTSFVQAAQTAFSSLPTDEEQRNAVLRLTELGVLNDTALGRESADLMRGLLSTDEQVLQDAMADIEEARLTGEAGGVIARMKQKPATKALFDLLGKSYKTPVEILTALDAAIDGAAKANAYYFELDVIERHYGDGKTTEEKEVMAATKIKRTFPSQSQRYDPVKAFGRSSAAMLVVPFIGWKSEVFRTMSNTPRLAMQEIKEGGVMAVRGWRRLLGFTGTLSVGGSAVGGAVTALFQFFTDDEEEEDRKLTPEELASFRESLPLWQRGHTLHARLLKSGAVQFVDLSSIMPHSQLTDMGQIINDSIRTGEGIGASRLASYVSTQLLGTQIAATAVFEAANNEDDFGNPIYVETDPAPVKMERMFKHLLQSAIKPAGYKFGEKVIRQGNQQRTEQLLGEVFGGKLNTLDNAEIQRRGLRGLKALQESAHSTISELTSGRYMDQEQVFDIVNRHQDAVNEAQRKLSRFMGSMLDMGSDPNAVTSNASVYRFSKDTIESAMQGYRIPWVPADKWFETVDRNVLSGGEQDPAERRMMIRQAVSTKPDVYWVRED